MLWSGAGCCRTDTTCKLPHAFTQQHLQQRQCRCFLLCRRIAILGTLRYQLLSDEQHIPIRPAAAAASTNNLVSAQHAFGAVSH